MNNLDILFTTEEIMQFEAALKRSTDAVARVPILIFKVTLTTLVFVIVCYSEWEIIYRVFDFVHVKTFGSRTDALNLLNPTFEISRRMKSQKVAGIVAQYIQSLPEQKEISQSSTYLVAWLEFTSGFNCTKGSQILVITDGLESSSYVDGNQLLQGKKNLSKAEVNLKGCALTFYGLGAGWMPQQVKIVRNEWERWAEQAGATFTAIIP